MIEQLESEEEDLEWEINEKLKIEIQQWMAIESELKIKSEQVEELKQELWEVLAELSKFDVRDDEVLETIIEEINNIKIKFEFEKEELSLQLESVKMQLEEKA